MTGMGDRPWGAWAAVDFTAPKEAIRSEAVCREIVSEVIQAIGMTPHGDPVVAWFGEPGTEKEGWTVVQLITTSHLAGHFCAHTGRCFLDIFSCRDFDVRAVVDALRDTLGREAVEEVATLFEPRW